MSDITIIGLGAMGSALASAYLAKGMEVTVWNRSAERAAPLVAKGARLAENAAGAIDASTLILVSVLD
ncbi:MAG: NAD(P)-binding domain-containing protein [Ectothiorhodospiraceae bacterium]|nr:NAD(P)-binding domain-containing protein [Ectothiorhodospiraceae bacterium]